MVVFIREIMQKCSFECYLVIDISRHKNKSHATQYNTRIHNSIGNITSHGLYVYVNMWWIGFYSSKLENPFFFLAYVILFFCHWFRWNFNKESRNEGIRKKNQTNSNSSSSSQWISNITFNAFALAFVLLADIVSFRLVTQKCRLWCQHRLLLYNPLMN